MRDDERGKRSGELAGVRERQQRVGPQIDEPSRLNLRNREGRRTDEGPATDLAAHQPPPVGLGVAARDGGDVHAQRVREIALRRQPIAGLQASGLDVSGNGCWRGRGRAGRICGRGEAATLYAYNIMIDIVHWLISGSRHGGHTLSFAADGAGRR